MLIVDLHDTLDWLSVLLWCGLFVGGLLGLLFGFCCLGGLFVLLNCVVFGCGLCLVVALPVVVCVRCGLFCLLWWVSLGVGS